MPWQVDVRAVRGKAAVEPSELHVAPDRLLRRLRLPRLPRPIYACRMLDCRERVQRLRPLWSTPARAAPAALLGTSLPRHFVTAPSGNC